MIDSSGLHGAETVLLTLMTAQKEMRLCPSLLSLGNNGAGQKAIEVEARNRGIEVNILRFSDGLNCRGALDIISVANSLRAHVIHSHGYKGDILLGMLPRKISRIPVVSTIHGWTSIKILSRMTAYEVVDAIALKRLNGVVVVSKAMQNYYLIKAFNIKSRIINNGLPELQFQNSIFEKMFPHLAKLCEKQFRILSIGRLSPEKGYDVLIHSVRILVQRKVEAGLVVVGDGTEMDRLKRIAARLDVADRIHFVGYVENAYRFMKSFDAFILPSFTEGLPITVLEAMQAEIPIIATAVGEVPDLLEQGTYGELIQPGNAEIMASGLETVYRNKDEAKKKACGARMKAFDNYGTERMAKQYLELYRDVLTNDN